MTITNKWIDDYFARYRQCAFPPSIQSSLIAFYRLTLRVRANRRKLLLAGNGASASIAAHGAVDFTKQAGVRAVSFSSDNFITCFANDYGYENWISRAIEAYYDSGDAVVLISASGRSPNVVKAAEEARSLGLPVVAFTGFSAKNPLRQRADIDLWVPQEAYNIVECVHMIWLTTVIDMVIGRAEYSVIDHQVRDAAVPMTQKEIPATDSR